MRANVTAALVLSRPRGFVFTCATSLHRLDIGDDWFAPFAMMPTDVGQALPAVLRGQLVLAGQTHSLFPETEKRNAALAPSFARYRAADGEPAEGAALREWLRTKLALDATWWPDGLLTGRGDARTIAKAEAKSIDFLLGWRSAVPIYHAVFAQDLAETVSRIKATTLVLEFTTAEEQHYGLQGERLAALMKHATARAMPVTFLAAMEEQTREIADALLGFLAQETDDVR